MSRDPGHRLPTRRQESAPTSLLLILFIILIPLAVGAQPGPAVEMTTGETKPWTITGESLEGDKTGLTRLIMPRAVQDSTVITADRGLYDRLAEILTLSGAVSIRDSSRTMTADSAHYDLNRRVALLLGNVRGRGPEGRFTARRLDYFRDEARMELTDSARVVDGPRILEALRIVYNTRDRTAVATDSVVLRDRNDDTRIRGRRADLYREKDLAIITGSPTLHRPGERGQEATDVSGDTLEMRFSDSLGVARGNVRILRGNVKARAGRAVLAFDRDLLRLQVDPVVIDPEGEVTGDSMAILLSSGRAQRLEVVGSAKVHYHPAEKPGEQNYVLGDTLITYLDSLGVREIQMRGRAKSFYIPSASDIKQGVGSNLSRGRRIRVLLEGGQAKRVDLESQASGDYVLPREKADTTAIRLPDSLYVERATAFFLASPDRSLPDSLERAGPFDPGERIVYQGETVTFLVPERQIEIRKKGKVHYKDLELNSEEIDYDAKRDRLVALGEPILKDPTSQLTGHRMVYRMDRRQGFVYQGKTEFEGGFYFGEEIKRVDDKILLVKGGDYTTCSADTSHYHFHSFEMKIHLGDKVVARPIILYLHNIPLMALPYWIFPIRKGRHSGILMPDIEFGFDKTRGRFVRNLGYYWAPNDYADAMLWTDYYERGARWIVNSRVNYKLRYVLDGNFFSSFSREEGIVNKKTRWDLRGGHSQEIGERATLKFRADFVSDKNYRDQREFGGTVDERLNRNLKSNIDLRKSWSSSSLSITADRNESLDREASTIRWTQNLPSIDFSMNSFALGRKPDERGRGGRLPLLSTVYSRFSASYRSTFQKPWDGHVKDGQAARMSTGLSDNRSLGRMIRVSPSISTTGAYFRRDVHGRSHGFGGVWSSGLSAASTLYGTFPLGLGPLLGIRHMIEPSASYSYSPEFKYLRVRSDTGQLVSRFPSVGGISLSGSKVNSMSMSLTQRFHLKLKGSDPRKPRKVENLILWSTSTGYNFREKGKKPWSAILNSIRLQPTRILESSLSLSHDPYRRNLRSLSVQTYLRLSGGGGGGADTASREPLDDYGSFGQAGKGSKRPGEKQLGATGPWSLNISHSYSRGEKRSSESSSMNLAASVVPTSNWRVTYSVYYDLRRHDIRSQELSLYRNLHCWEAHFDRRVSGTHSEYNFRINIKDLPDVKYERQRR